MTERDPTSGFSFLSYLHEKGRLERFINRKSFFPSRVEFNDYPGWAAGRLGNICAYDQRVTEVQPVEQGGSVTHLRIMAEDARRRRSLRLARQIVLAPGGQPHWSELFAPLRGLPGLSHSKDFTRAVLPHVGPGQRVAIIGGGQSASEIFAALSGHPAKLSVDLILRGHALKPADDSPFVNEVFDIAHTDILHRMEPGQRDTFLRDFAAPNYAVTDADLLQQIYGMLYEQDVAGERRFALWRDTRATAVQHGPDGFALTLQGPHGRQDRAYDHVILCTGFRRDLATTCLRGLLPWIQSPTPAPQDGASALLAERINQRQILLCDAIRILGSADRAEDVLQEAALHCLDQARAVTQIDRPAHFARRMVRNLAIDRLRRDRPLVTGDLPEVAGNCENPEQRVAGQQALAHVDRLLSGYTLRDRQMFLQHRLMGETQNRLAERFGLSAARVNAIIGRIHGQLAPLGLDLLTG